MTPPETFSIWFSFVAEISTCCSIFRHEARTSAQAVMALPSQLLSFPFNNMSLNWNPHIAELFMLLSRPKLIMRTWLKNLSRFEYIHLLKYLRLYIFYIYVNALADKAQSWFLSLSQLYYPKLNCTEEGPIKSFLSFA